MKTILRLTILFNAFSLNIIAQTTFEKTYGDSIHTEFKSVIQLSNGNYVAVGTYYGTNQKVYLVKTNSSGDTLWTKTFGSPNNDERACALLQTSDGGFILYGDIAYSVGPNWGDLLLIKTDSLGNYQWSHTYGGTSDWEWAGGNSGTGDCLQITSDGGFALMGETYSFGIGPYLVKTDSNGNQIWQHTYWGNALNAVQQTSDGGYIMVGNYSAVLHLIKTNSIGDTMWTKSFQGHFNARGMDVKITSDNGYILGGMTEPASNDNMFLFKTNSVGDSSWYYTYGGTNTEWGNSVVQTTDNRYATVGYTYSFGAGSSDVYLIKTNNIGDTLWTKTFGDTLQDIGSCIRQTSDLGFIICGSTNSYSTNTRAYLIKTDSLGAVMTTTGIKETSKHLTDKIEIYPNPFTSQTTIAFSNEQKNYISIHAH
jgi:hypothetical protein